MASCPRRRDNGPNLRACRFALRTVEGMDAPPPPVPPDTDVGLRVLLGSGTVDDDMSTLASLDDDGFGTVLAALFEPDGPHGQRWVRVCPQMAEADAP